MQQVCVNTELLTPTIQSWALPCPGVCERGETTQMMDLSLMLSQP